MDEKNIDQLLNELVDLLEANAGTTIRHRDRWRQTTRHRLAGLPEDEIRAQYARLSGTATPASRTSGGNDYHVRQLDHAITDAIAMLGLGVAPDGTGERTFDDATIAALLTDEYGAAIAGRALSIALDGDYRVDLGRSQTRSAERDATIDRVTLAEYQATLGRADTADAVDSQAEAS
jgi:hypothetical protein